jgi:hypothetical protein
MRQSDHGLDECAQVKQTLDKHLGISLTVVDASLRFMEALKGVIEPEKVLYQSLTYSTRLSRLIRYRNGRLLGIFSSTYLKKKQLELRRKLRTAPMRVRLSGYASLASISLMKFTNSCLVPTRHGIYETHFPFLNSRANIRSFTLMSLKAFHSKVLPQRSRLVASL